MLQIFWTPFPKNTSGALVVHMSLISSDFFNYYRVETDKDCNMEMIPKSFGYDFKQIPIETFFKIATGNTWEVCPSDAINMISTTARKTKLSSKDLLSKYDQILRKLRIWSHLLKKSLTENFIFCTVYLIQLRFAFLKVVRIIKRDITLKYLT